MHLMIDIETMSVHESRALILSVAVVPFVIDRADAPFIGDGQTWVLDPREQLVMPRFVDRDTQAWWAKQKPEAKSSWLENDTKSLNVFSLEFMALCAEHRDGVWANGACFDLCNLVQLMEDCGHERPWPYNLARDARTIYATMPKLRETPYDLAIAHDPLNDCIYQIKKLWQYWPLGIDEVLAPSNVSKAAA